MSVGVVRIETNRLLAITLRRTIAFLITLIGESPGAEHQLMGLQVFGWTPANSVHFGAMKGRFDDADDRTGEFVLDGKEIIEGPVIAFRPAWTARPHLKQFGGYTSALASAPRSRFERATRRRRTARCSATASRSR